MQPWRPVDRSSVDARSQYDVSMQDRAALIVNRPLPGQIPTLAEPIPELALVALPVFLRAEYREWVTAEDESSRVTICGHVFRIVGYHEHCLVLEHRCCGVTAVP